MADFAIEGALSGIVFEQVGEVVGRDEIASATTSTSLPTRPCSTIARNAKRPIRPKPLIATLIDIIFALKIWGGRIIAVA